MTSYIKNISSNLSTQVLLILIQIGMSIIVARTLGPTGQGHIAYALIIFSLIAQFGHLSVLNAHEYFLSGKSKRIQIGSREVFNNNLSYSIITSSIWIVIIIILNKFNFLLNDFSDVVGDLLFIAILLIIPVLTIVPKLRNTLYFFNKVLYENRLNIIKSLLHLTTITVLWTIGQLDLKTFFLVYVISEIVLLIFYLRKINIPFKFYLNRLLIKEEFKFGINIFFASLFVFSMYRIDMFMIKYFEDFNQLGLYSVAVGISEKIFTIPVAVGVILFARILNSVNKKENKRVSLLTCKYSFFSGIVIALPLFILAPYLIKILYGNAFAPSITIIQILLPGAVFAIIGKIMGQYYIAEGKPRIHTIVSGVSLSVNLILNFSLIPTYGIIGAAIASSIAYFIYGITYLLLITNRSLKEVLSFFVITKYDYILIKSIIQSGFKKINAKN